MLRFMTVCDAHYRRYLIRMFRAFDMLNRCLCVKYRSIADACRCIVCGFLMGVAQLGSFCHHAAASQPQL